MDLLLSSLPRRGLVTVYNDTKKTQKNLSYYFSFFPHSVGFLVEFICQTNREYKIESKMQKMKKTQFFKIWTYYTFEFHRRYTIFDHLVPTFRLVNYKGP